MKHSLILFDFDGTLMDTANGIYYSATKAMQDLGLEISQDTNMKLFIGPPLADCFRITFGLEEKYIEKACQAYKMHYNRKGRFMASFYPKVKETLKVLQEAGLNMCVATMKTQDLALWMTRHFCLSEYFCKVYGSDPQGRKTKADLISSAKADFDLENAPERVLLVGDTMLDYEASRLEGIDFLGAGFGFGDFGPKERQEFSYPLLESFEELPRLLLRDEPPSRG